MIANAPAFAEEGDGIDLGALWRVLWSYKIPIVIAGLVGGAIAAYLAMVATPVYRAETVISEVRDRSSLGSGLASQLGGLASLAGVSLGGANAGSESQAVLKSKRLTEEFIKRNKLLPELFPGEPRKQTAWFGVKRFQESVMQIREDKLKGVTTLTVDSNDPAKAARWANDFVALANEMIRDRALTIAKRNLAYLNEQITRTNEVELRRVLYELIENETKTVMLANGRPEYAFTVVDPATVPELRISPRRTLMVILGVLLGGVLGVLGAFAHNAIVRGRPVTASP